MLSTKSNPMRPFTGNLTFHRVRVFSVSCVMKSAEESSLAFMMNCVMTPLPGDALFISKSGSCRYRGMKLT